MIDVSDLSWEENDSDNDCTPLEAILLVKGFDAEGNLILYERCTQGITPWEMLGMVTTFADGLRRLLLNEEP